MKLNKLYQSFFQPESADKPYGENAEHLSELFSFLDLCLTAVAAAKGLESSVLLNARETGSLPALSVAAQDVEQLLRRDLPDELNLEAREQIALARLHIRKRIKLCLENDFVPRFELLRETFLLDEFEAFAMLLALSSEYDRKYEGIYSWLHNNESDICATKWLAVRLYGFLFGGSAASQAAVLTGESPLCRFLCSRELTKRDRSENAGRLVLSRRVTSYLFGQNTLDPFLRDFCAVAGFNGNTYVPFREEQTKQALHFLLKKGFRSKGCFVLNMYGESGIGRTVTASRAAAAIRYDILKIRLSDLCSYGREGTDKLLDMIYTETVLLGAVPCFVSEAKEPRRLSEDEPAAADYDESTLFAARKIAELFRFVFWFSREKSNPFEETNAEVYGMELPMLTANERRMFWQASLPGTELDLSSFANRYTLTPKTIIQSANLAKSLAASENIPVNEKHITAAVKQHSNNPLGLYAQKINAVFTWDDLIVSDEQKSRMQMICNQVKYRSIVNEDWGFRKKSPYGRGLCALFYGSPGTGKTMAVQVMANELGLDLYRIDLSQLTSKYIGETQKNIAALFRKAKNINAMLFFDEADSMFAKRSEVKDSNDRYANADTAFLLQKLEDFEGIAILATNYVNNIDDAFKRRIKFMINFVFPTPEVRLSLWKKILPEAARCDEPLDFEFFADRFELSGSSIKEILTNAAFIAASQGSGIRNSHVIEAVKLNYSKYGKILTNADFDYLG